MKNYQKKINRMKEKNSEGIKKKKQFDIVVGFILFFIFLYTGFISLDIIRGILLTRKSFPLWDFI